MRIRIILTIAFALLTLHNLVAQENDSTTSERKEIIKTGYNFGPLPAVAFDADKGFQLGANDFINKPIIMEKLLSSVTTQINLAEANKKMK